MSANFHYPFPPLIPGILRKRYKRFLADIELTTGEMVTAHCANTGPMTGVCQIGAPVYLSKSDNPKRKLAYTWELIQIENAWVGVNTSLPNRVIKAALTQQQLPPLVDQYETVKSEVRYGQDQKSRIDFLLTSPTQPDCYVEVKNTTLAQGKRALFPDTVTTRGQKHLRELTAIATSGRAKAVMLYFINREDCDEFAPGDDYDPQYGQLLRSAVDAGVAVLPCRFEVTPEGLTWKGLAKIVSG